MCAPPFEKTPVKMMRAVLFNPGNKQNGGIFSQTQSWAVLAEVLAGDGDIAWRYFRSFMPAAQNDRADIREIEPYVHCQSTHSQFSENLDVHVCLGFPARPHGRIIPPPFSARDPGEPGGLRIDPCIPKDWPGFTATRKFRGMKLHIEVKRRGESNHQPGVIQIKINGVSFVGNLLAQNQLHDRARITAII